VNYYSLDLALNFFQFSLELESGTITLRDEKGLILGKNNPYPRRLALIAAQYAGNGLP
jgi:hypothetical protein